MKQMLMLAFLLCAASAQVSAQSYRSTVNEGNEYYRQQEYDRAREKYEQAAADEPDRIESYFNAGNAAYRAATENTSAEDVQAALQAYEKAGTRIENSAQLARTFYNAGNTFLQAAEKGLENPLLQQAAGEQGGDMRKQGYLRAIDMYKRTLKIDPDDADARYNLTYAKKKLQDLQKQQQDQKQDKEEKKDQKQDKQQDQQQQDKSRDEQEQKKDQQNQDQQQQQNQKDRDQEDDARNKQQQQSKPEQQQKMSKQQAEQILRALEREEKALQKKKRMKVNTRTEVEKDW
ncbi:MAG: tetratricopeptide repeat protein [Bacteroidota bacterium]|nr:tetratricopeptide repeat protein [Bacteroidota bacterium]